MENKSLNMWEQTQFDSEFILHKLTEKYIKEKNLFGLKYVGSEIQYNKLRIDTLAYDEEKETFVIIEYKNKKDNNVINQVQGYYDLLKESSNEENIPKELANISDNIRAMIIAPDFYGDIEKESENLEYLELYRISLWKCSDEKYYVTYENNDSEEIRLDADPKDLKITKEDVFKNKSEEIEELYNNFEKELYDDFENSFGSTECLDIKYLVDAVSVKAHNNFICNISVKESIKIYFYTHRLNKINKRLDEDNCPKKNLRNIAYLSTGGPLVYFELTLTPEDKEYAVEIILQIDEEKRGNKK